MRKHGISERRQEQLNAASRRYKKRHAEKVRQYGIEYRKKKPSVHRVAARKWYWKNREKVFATRYGISEEEFRALGTECHVCGSIEKLCVDHDHNTGRVRGLLCTQCNHGLGNFKDRPDLLEKAVRYLSCHEETTKSAGA